METIGENILIERTRKKLSQQGLADLIGIDQHKMSDIETGKKSPSWELIEKIAQNLETPIIDLLPKSSLNVFNNTFTEHSVQNNQCSVHNNHDAIQGIIKTIEELKSEINKLK